MINEKSLLVVVFRWEVQDFYTDLFFKFHYLHSLAWDIGLDGLELSIKYWLFTAIEVYYLFSALGIFLANFNFSNEF